jgi:hypothetical protein
LGTLFGIFVFGETVQYFEDFWNSSYYGRVTIMDWLNLPTGVVVVGVVLMALFMFWGAELLERRLWGQGKAAAHVGALAGAGALVAGAVLVLIWASRRRRTSGCAWRRKRRRCWPSAPCRSILASC